MNRAQRREKASSTKPLSLARQIMLFAPSSRAIINLRRNGKIDDYDLNSLKVVTQMGHIVSRVYNYNALHLNPLFSLIQSIEVSASVEEDQIDAADRALAKIQTMCSRTPAEAWAMACNEFARHIDGVHLMQRMEKHMQDTKQIGQLGEQHA